MARFDKMVQALEEIRKDAEKRNEESRQARASIKTYHSKELGCVTIPVPEDA